MVQNVKKLVCLWLLSLVKWQQLVGLSHSPQTVGPPATYWLLTTTCQLPPTNCHMSTARFFFTRIFLQLIFFHQNIFATEFFSARICFSAEEFFFFHTIFFSQIFFPTRKHKSGPEGTHRCSQRLQPSAGARKSCPKGGTFSSYIW